MSVLRTLDDSLGRYPHIVATIEALSTFAAVVVSLGLALIAQRANRTRLSANLFVVQEISERSEIRKTPNYLALSITNNGIMPLIIPFSFFYWKIPFQRHLGLVSPLDYFGDPHLPRRTYPVQIAPRSTERFYLSTSDVMIENFRQMHADQKSLGRWAYRFIHANVATADGAVFRVKLDNNVREEIKAAAG